MMSDVQALFDERAGLSGLSVPSVLKDRLLAYFALLHRWNRKINLTALSDPAPAIDRLLLEPVSAAAHLPTGVAMADLGSGGGSPAIPLALALEAPSLLMVESRSRKAAFLREAAREVGLHAIVEAARFEELIAEQRHTDVAGLVSIRAVRPDAIALTLARQVCNSSGIVALFATSDELEVALQGFRKRSTWNIKPSGMLITFHVAQN